MIAQKDGQRYISEDGRRVTGWVAFTVALLAYAALLTDELPGSGRTTVGLEIVPSGSQTVGTALLRIVKAIPKALALALLGLVSWVVWLVTAVSILINERYPEGLWNFRRGVIRWEARLLGYLASLVEAYPPFSLDTGSEDAPTTTPTGGLEPSAQ